MPDLASADGKKKRSRSRRSSIDFRYLKEIQVKSFLPHNPVVNQQLAKESKFHCSESEKKHNKKKAKEGDDDVLYSQKIEEDATTINIFPDDILIIILSLLNSTREACRTTILSKRWKNLWTQVPSHDFRVTGPNKQFMFRYLALAPTNIIKLSLQSNQSIHWISMWASSVAEHHVENLTLKVCKGPTYGLPESFYCQPTLRSLRIRGGILLPQGTVNWRAIVILKVSRTNFKGICKIGDVLLGCPALECLMLRWVFISMLSSPVLISHRKLKILSVKNVFYYTRKKFMLAEVHVSTPQLENLEISGKWCRISCKIIEDLPMLVESHLGFSLLIPMEESDPLYVARKQQNNLKNLLEKVRYSKKLLLGDYCQKVYDDMNRA